MQKLIDIVTQVIISFNEAGVVCECDDSSFDGDTQDLTVEGIHVVINDDSHREEWSTVLEASGRYVREALEKVLGEPKVMPNGVLNWDVDGVLVVANETVEFYEEYEKVAARSSR